GRGPERRVALGAAPRLRPPREGGARAADRLAAGTPPAAGNHPRTRRRRRRPRRPGRPGRPARTGREAAGCRDPEALTTPSAPETCDVEGSEASGTEMTGAPGSPGADPARSLKGGGA